MYILKDISHSLRNFIGYILLKIPYLIKYRISNSSALSSNNSQYMRNSIKHLLNSVDQFARYNFEGLFSPQFLFVTKL